MSDYCIYNPLPSRAPARLGVCDLLGMELALLFHPDWTGGQDPREALQALHMAGVRALELNVPPRFKPGDEERWQRLVVEAQARFTLHLHAPLAPGGDDWPAVFRLIRTIMGGQAEPPVIVVHAPTTTRARTDITDAVQWLQSLLEAVPAPAKIGLELGWNWGAQVGIRARWRRWRMEAARRAGSRGRPSGIGSGLGTRAAPEGNTTSAPVGKGVVDPGVDLAWNARALRQGGYNAAGTRQTALEMCDAVADERVCLAWDLAHDWLAGPWSGDASWTTIPSERFLRRVGYVRLHDAADDGTDHLPLVVGNVPYTTQLRTLLRLGFDGPVCLAIRYPRTAARHGNRKELQTQSLLVARRVLKMM